MIAIEPTKKKSLASRKERPEEIRVRTSGRIAGPATDDVAVPAAGAHAAHHLVNEDATPGAGVLPSHAHRSGKEVDGGAG